MSNLKSKISDWVINKISDPETKSKVVSKWNENVNIPILNEKTEEKIISAIWETVEAVLKKVILK